MDRVGVRFPSLTNHLTATGNESREHTSLNRKLLVWNCISRADNLHFRDSVNAQSHSCRQLRFAWVWIGLNWCALVRVHRISIGRTSGNCCSRISMGSCGGAASSRQGATCMTSYGPRVTSRGCRTDRACAVSPRRLCAWVAFNYAHLIQTPHVPAN